MMIHEVDESLRTLVRRDVVDGEDIEVLFDAPTKDWAARRNAPTVDLYLYDIREDLRCRQLGIVDVPDRDGHTTARRQLPRFFKLSYLMTAWTQRPEDEHRLLSALLACFLRNDHVPKEVLFGDLATDEVTLSLTVAIPPPQDRALSDVWTALGGELKPSLDLVVIAPFDLDRMKPTAQAVTAGPAVTVGPVGDGPNLGAPETRTGRGAPAPANGDRGPDPGSADDAEPAPPKRTVRIRKRPT